jgi:hypothetical protein
MTEEKFIKVGHILESLRTLSSFYSSRRSCKVYGDCDLHIVGKLRHFSGCGDSASLSGFYLQDETGKIAVQLAQFQSEWIESDVILTHWTAITPVDCLKESDRFDLCYIEVTKAPRIVQLSNETSSFPELTTDAYERVQYDLEELQVAIPGSMNVSSYVKRDQGEKQSQLISIYGALKAKGCLHTIPGSTPFFFVELSSESTPLYIVFKGKQEAIIYYTLNVGDSLFFSNLISSIVFPGKEMQKSVLAFRCGTSQYYPLLQHLKSQLSEKDGIVSYRGVITKVIDVALGTYLLDNKYTLYLCFLPSASLLLGQGFRKGATLAIFNTHVMTTRFTLCKSTPEIAFVPCSYTCVQLVGFSPEDTPYSRPAAYLRSKFSPFRFQLCPEDVICLRWLFGSFRKRFQSFITENDLLGSFSATSYAPEKREGILWKLLEAKKLETTPRDVYQEFFDHPVNCAAFNSTGAKVLFPSIKDLLEYLQKIEAKCYDATNDSYQLKVIPSKRLSSYTVVLSGLLRGSKSGTLLLYDATGSIPVVIDDTSSLEHDSTIWAIDSFKVVIEWIGTDLLDISNPLKKVYLSINSQDLKILHPPNHQIGHSDVKERGNGPCSDNQESLCFFVRNRTVRSLHQATEVVSFVLHGSVVYQTKQNDLPTIQEKVTIRVDKSSLSPFIVPNYMYRISGYSKLDCDQVLVISKESSFIRLAPTVLSIDSRIKGAKLKYSSISVVDKMVKDSSTQTEETNSMYNFHCVVVRKAFVEERCCSSSTLYPRAIFDNLNIGTGKPRYLLHLVVRDTNNTEAQIDIFWKNSLLEFPLGLISGRIAYFSNIQVFYSPEFRKLVGYFHSFSYVTTIEPSSEVNSINVDVEQDMDAVESVMITNLTTLCHGEHFSITARIDSLLSAVLWTCCETCGFKRGGHHSCQSCKGQVWKVDGTATLCVSDGSGDVGIQLDSLQTVCDVLGASEEQRMRIKKEILQNDTIQITSAADDFQNCQSFQQVLQSAINQTERWLGITCVSGYLSGSSSPDVGSWYRQNGSLEVLKRPLPSVRFISCKELSLVHKALENLM